MEPDSESPNEEPEHRAFELLSATPLGDVFLLVAVCAAGAFLVAAFSVHPIISSGAILAVVVGFVWWAGRKANRPWLTSDYLTFGLFTIVGLAVVVLIVVGLWVMLCDC